jgi:hypothetical protein
MKMIPRSDGVRIVPENGQDVAYLRDTLGIDTSTSSHKLLLVEVATRSTSRGDGSWDNDVQVLIPGVNELKRREGIAERVEKMGAAPVA